MGYYLQEDVKIAIEAETKCLVWMTLITSVWWHLCCVAALPAPWLTPIILIIGLNIYFLLKQCRNGFSPNGVLFRLIMDFALMIIGFLIITITYSLGYKAPDEFTCMSSFPYTAGAVAVQVGISRALIMLGIFALRAGGADI